MKTRPLGVTFLALLTWVAVPWMGLRVGRRVERDRPSSPGPGTPADGTWKAVVDAPLSDPPASPAQP